MDTVDYSRSANTNLLAVRTGGKITPLVLSLGR